MLRCFYSLACVACLFIGLAVPVAAQAPGQCVITQTEGEAVVSARGAGRQPAVVGLGLGTNATLRTRADARVVMECSGGLRVVLGPDSRIRLSGLLQGAQAPLGLRLLDGIAGFLFDGDGSDGVQVRTPSAVAAVRSTEWAMRVQDRASAVFTREGAVFVVGREGRVRLEPGNGVDVTARGAVGPVVDWGQARIDRFKALLGPAW
jgi:hypothetical protein